MRKNEREEEKSRRTSAKAWADKQERGFEPTAFKLPRGINLFSTKKADTYKIDIIPYKVGEGNPDADEGMEHFERTYYIHSRIGIQEKSYCCLMQTFKEDCPICQHAAKLRRQGKEELADAYRPQKRMLWNVVDRNDKEKGIQIWDTAYFKAFGEMLKDKVKADEQYENFADLKDGMTLKLFVKDSSFSPKGGGTVNFKQIGNIEMVARKEPYPPDTIKKASCLDACLVKVEYDELKKVFEQGGLESEENDDEDHDTNGKAGSDDATTADDYGLKKGDVVLLDGDEYTITKISGDGTSLTLKDEDDEIKAGVDPADVKKKPAKKAEPEPDDNDEEDDPDPEDASDLEDEDEGDSDLEPGDSEDKEDEESEDEDDWDENEDEEEEKPKPGRKPKK